MIAPSFNKIDNKLLLIINKPIKIDIHNHPLIFCLTPERAKCGSSWICNKCLSSYNYENASFYCISCDFDVCENCLANYKLNEVNLYNFNNNLINSPNLDNNFKWLTKLPLHAHFLTLVKRKSYNYSWKCENCSKAYNEKDSSYYCSLCDYNICKNCHNFMLVSQVKTQIITTHQTPNDNFQIKSFKILNEKYHNKNLLYCPFPVQLLFTLLANGITPGNALDEIKNGFLIQDLNDENNYYLNLLSTIRNYSSLNITNSFYSKFFPSNQFKMWLTKYFSTFSNSIYELNNLIETNTNGKVKNYYKAQDTFEDMILVNVLYFKGEWQKTFIPTSHQNIFYKSNNQIIHNVQYMECKSDFQYYHDDSIEVIELPYIKDNMSALILLPSKSISLDIIINELNQEKLNILYNKLSKQKVDLTMPKFKFERSDERINLVDMINKLGVKQIFEFSTNNFIPLFKDNGEEHTKFKINKVFQTNLLSIDECGTKIVSVTSVSGRIFSPPPSEECIMVVDRPFLFIIRNKIFQKGKDIILIAKIEDISN